jgi:hypothetical protein
LRVFAGVALGLLVHAAAFVAGAIALRSDKEPEVFVYLVLGIFGVETIGTIALSVVAYVGMRRGRDDLPIGVLVGWILGLVALIVLWLFGFVLIAANLGRDVSY